MTTMMVYRYGLLSPIENAQLVELQMHASHDLRNELVQIERARRAALRTSTRGGEVERLEREIIASREDELAAAIAIKVTRKGTRSKSETADMRQRLVVAREKTRDLRSQLFAARSDARDLAEVERAEGFADALKKDAYRLMQDERGINWGARWLAETAVDAARTKLPYLYDRDGLTPLDPKFKRWTGDGAITVQLTGESGEEELKGLAAADIEGEESTFARIGPPVLNTSRPKKGTTKKHRTFFIRVGSNADRTPIWAKFPMFMHRPLPPRAVIKRATVTRRLNGPNKIEWSVEFTIDVSLSPRREECGAGVVALNLGWRKVNGGLRVVTHVDDEGKVGTFILIDDVIGSFRKVDDVREIRDKNFDVMRAKLKAWLDTFSPPDWLVRDTKSIEMWRAKGHLAVVIARWKERRFQGDFAMVEELIDWEEQDRHLWQWDANGRTGTVRYRRDLYRKFAANLARKYRTVVIDDTDYSELARHEPTESPKAEIAPARSFQFLASCGELRSIIEHAFRVRGGNIVRVDGDSNTIRCHKCGNFEDFDHVTDVEHTCGGCGVRWDQDENNAFNAYARYREQLHAEKESETARMAEKEASMTPTGSKWARRKEAKKRRKETAREPAPNEAE